MSSKHLALARVLAAAAWADGRVEPEEVNIIKTFMLRAKLSPDDVADVSVRLESPISQSEADELTREFLAQVPSGADRQKLFGDVQDILEADGELGEDEKAFLDSLRQALEGQGVVDGVLGKIRGFFSRAARHDRSTLAEELRTRLQDRVRDSLDHAPTDDERFDRAVLFGGLLHAVARADGTVDTSEVEQIRSILVGRGDLPDDELHTVTDVVGAQITADVDEQRLAGAFNRVSDEPDRRRLVEALFAVAMADGELDERELERVRRISDYLWIDRRTFNDIRLAATS